mmetsp:Transcript_62110/g.136655  ORF Transcript_62110/g.136655 Transcript_62110/m.136655 type:complete len:223 (+) Transcript_62110:136-804(+)
MRARMDASRATLNAPKDATASSCVVADGSAATTTAAPKLPLGLVAAPKAAPPPMASRKSVAIQRPSEGRDSSSQSLPESASEATRNAASTDAASSPPASRGTSTMAKRPTFADRPSPNRPVQGVLGSHQEMRSVTAVQELLLLLPPGCGPRTLKVAAKAAKCSGERAATWAAWRAEAPKLRPPAARSLMSPAWSDASAQSDTSVSRLARPSAVSLNTSLIRR